MEKQCSMAIQCASRAGFTNFKGMVEIFSDDFLGKSLAFRLLTI
jgi:hypothetical protein